MCEPKLGKSLGVRRLELAGGADLVGRVAGHHLVDGGRVVEQAVGRVAHRADHRELVVHLRELRQDLGELMPGIFVGMVLNALRTLSGASALGSHRSRWLGPPWR